jgi:hypothetical protein
MPNIDNINKAIAIMLRAKNLNMTAFQANVNGLTLVTTEEELHKCGNTACFAGYVAVSPEWQAEGGLCVDGSPQRDEAETPEGDVIAEWLGISRHLAFGIVFGGVASDKLETELQLPPWDTWTPADVIKVLEAIKAGQFI